MTERKGQNSSHIQTANRNLILQILSQKKICTRVELSKLTGLTQASITITVNYMIEMGVLKEVGMISGTRGRRCIAIALNEPCYKVAAIAMNRTTFSIGLFDIGGTCYESHTGQIVSENGARSSLEEIIKAVKTMLQGKDDVYAVGMAVAGPYLRSEHRIALLTEFQGWTDIDLMKTVAAAVQLPVYIEHDANAGVMGEWLYGKLEDRNNCIVDVLTGDGVGAGIIDHGNLFFGNNGIAGQFGHISLDAHGPRCACGNYGCLELYCSTYALVRSAEAGLPAHPDSSLCKLETITWQSVFDGAEQNDAFCMDLIHTLGQRFGYGLVNLVNAYDPRYIILDGLYAQKRNQLFLSAVRDTVQQRVLPEIFRNLTIRYSERPVFSVLQGAAAIAANELLSDSNWMINHTKQQE